MSAVKRIALFLWNAENLSAYGQMLLTWAQRSRHDVVVFSDHRQDEHRHYLQFDAVQSDNAFQLLLHDVDDTPAHAVGFGYVAMLPSVIFLNQLALPAYARSISHSLDDPAGTGWLIRKVWSDDANKAQRVASLPRGMSELAERRPFAAALDSISLASVVPSEDAAVLLENCSTAGRPAEILETDADPLYLFARLDADCLRWSTLEPPPAELGPHNPYGQPRATERKRLEQMSAPEYDERSADIEAVLAVYVPGFLPGTESGDNHEQ